MLSCKNIVLFTILFLTCVNASTIDFGIGFTIEQPRQVQYADMSHKIEMNKVYLPITIFSRFRAVPEIAYWNALYGLDDEQIKISVLHMGIGMYYLVPFDQTSIYFGPRAALIRFQNPEKIMPPSRIALKTDNVYGLTFGAEYNILKSVRIGLEIQYNQYEMKPWTDYGHEENDIQRGLETCFVFSFHL